jgi:hypothetical protein
VFDQSAVDGQNKEMIHSLNGRSIRIQHRFDGIALERVHSLGQRVGPVYQYVDRALISQAEAIAGSIGLGTILIGLLFRGIFKEVLVAIGASTIGGTTWATVSRHYSKWGLASDASGNPAPAYEPTSPPKSEIPPAA